MRLASGAFAAGAGARLGRRRLGLGRLELEAELHRGIEKAGDRLERHRQPFRHAAERQADLEGLVRTTKSQN